jgi:hypothetical protein
MRKLGSAAPALALRRLTVLAVALLFVLTSMVFSAGSASAVVRSKGPYSLADCRTERTAYARYYDDVSYCYFDWWYTAYFFDFDDES